MSQMKMEMWRWEHHNRLQRVNKLNGLGVGWRWGLFLLFRLIDSCGEGENKQTDESCRIFGTWREVGMELGTGLITWVMQACRLKTLNGPHELNNRTVHNEVGKIGDLAKFIYFPSLLLPLGCSIWQPPKTFLVVVKKIYAFAADALTSFSMRPLSRLQDGGGSKLGKLLKGIDVRRSRGAARGSII